MVGGGGGLVVGGGGGLVVGGGGGLVVGGHSVDVVGGGGFVGGGLGMATARVTRARTTANESCIIVVVIEVETWLLVAEVIDDFEPLYTFLAS